MGQIGHNQTRNDALNGVPSGGNAGIGSDSMKQMEKDLSSTRTGMSMDSTNNIAGNKREDICLTGYREAIHQVKIMSQRNREVRIYLEIMQGGKINEAHCSSGH